MKTDIRTLPEWQQYGLTLKSQLDNALGRVDYPFFVKEILGYGHIANDPNNPGNFEQFNDPRVQQNLEAVGSYFQDWLATRHEQVSFRKVMLIQPRGTCKSATCTIPLPIYAHLNDSEIACAVIGAKHKDIAEQFSKATRSTFQGDDEWSRLTELYGAFKGGGPGRDWQVSQMTTSKRKNLGRSDPTYAAYSIAKGATSSHFDLLVMDDPVTREAMEGDSEWLEKVWAAYIRLPYLINRNGLFILVMTRYHDGDLCGRIVREEIAPIVQDHFNGSLPRDFNTELGWIKYAHIAGWDVRYDSVYDEYDRETRTGKVVYPICWSHEKIMHSRRTDAGEAEFWFHLMNAPQKREDQPITEEHIKSVWVDSLDDVPPQAWKCLDMHCDFSFKDEAAFRKQSGDWGVAHLVAKYNGHVYRVNGIRAKLTQERFGVEMMKLVAWAYYEHKAQVRFITYDKPTNFGSGDSSTNEWIYSLFRANRDLPRAAPKPISRQRGAGAKKIGRILDTVWAWQQGNVHLVRRFGGAGDRREDLIPFNDELIYQALNIGYTTHDDDIDAFSDAFSKECYVSAPYFSHDSFDDEGEDFKWEPAVRGLEDDDPWEEHLGFGV